MTLVTDCIAFCKIDESQLFLLVACCVCAHYQGSSCMALRPTACRYGQRVGQETVKTLRTCLTQIYQREGIRGFYKGALPSLIKAAPSAAVTFATYEFVVAYLATLMHEHSNQAQERRRP